MKTVPINEATLNQIRDFALGTLGIEIKPSSSIEQARALVVKSWDKAILVEDAGDDSETVGTAPTPITDAQKAPGPEKVRLVIGVTEEAGGADPIQLGVNGKVMLVPRGIEVEIPLSYFEVLQHAVTHKYDSLPDGGMNPVPREVMLYPFQRVA